MPQFAVAWLCDEATRRTACQFLEQVLIVVPDKLHTILTDNGIQFAEQTRNCGTILSHQSGFDVTCESNGIEHRLTQSNDPCTSGQMERMNRTIKDAITKRYH